MFSVGDGKSLWGGLCKPITCTKKIYNTIKERENAKKHNMSILKDILRNVLICFHTESKTRNISWESIILALNL